MPYFCKYCARPDIAQIFDELKRGTPRTSVVAKFGLDPDKDYGPLGKCFNDHRPHDHVFEVAESIKRTKKTLAAEFKKKQQDRILIKDLEARLKSLRDEERTLARIAKEDSNLLPGDARSFTTEDAAKFQSYIDGVLVVAARTSYASPAAILLAAKPEILSMFARIVRDPALLAAARALITPEVLA